MAIGNTSTYFFARILLTGREIEIYREDEFHSANNSRTRLLLKLVSYEKLRKKLPFVILRHSWQLVTLNCKVVIMRVASLVDEMKLLNIS